MYGGQSDHRRRQGGGPGAQGFESALRAIVASLADSAMLLETVRRLCRWATNQAGTVAELKKKTVTALQPALEVALRRRLDQGTLPATVGWLLQKKKPLLFLRSDVH